MEGVAVGMMLMLGFGPGGVVGDGGGAGGRCLNQSLLLRLAGFGVKVPL